MRIEVDQKDLMPVEIPKVFTDREPITRIKIIMNKNDDDISYKSVNPLTSWYDLEATRAGAPLSLHYPLWTMVAMLEDDKSQWVGEVLRPSSPPPCSCSYVIINVSL